MRWMLIAILLGVAPAAALAGHRDYYDRGERYRHHDRGGSFGFSFGYSSGGWGDRWGTSFHYGAYRPPVYRERVIVREPVYYPPPVVIYREPVYVYEPSYCAPPVRYSESRVYYRW